MKATSLDILGKAHLPPAQAKAILTVMDAELEHSTFATKADLSATEAGLSAKISEAIAEAKSEIIKWMFGFGIGQMVAVVGIVKLLK